MLKFNLSSHRIVVDPKSLMIKELRDIYDADTDQLKRQATNILTYIHLVSQIDPEAPYFSSREDEVEALAAMDVWGKSYAETQSLDGFEEVIEAYRLAHEKPENRIVQTFNRKLDQLHDMLTTVVPEIEKSVNLKTGTFTYVTNTRAIMQVMKDLDEVMNAKEQLEERIKNKRTNDVKVRGDKRTSFLDKRRMAEAGRRTRTKQNQTENGATTEEGNTQGAEAVPKAKPERNHQAQEAVLGAGPAGF